MVDLTRPYIGASPDALMLSKCHDQSIVEIKCPYAIKYSSYIAENVGKCSFFYQFYMVKLQSIDHINIMCK